MLALADGCVVGTSLKRDGSTWNEVDPVRVERLVAAAADSDLWEPARPAS
jgi:predicted TIM-barrel enzyme